MVAARTRVLLGLKVEDDPDRWAPPVGETERGTTCQGLQQGEEARRLAGLRRVGPKPGTGPRREEKGGRGTGRPRGRKEWAKPESGEGERKFFSIF